MSNSNTLPLYSSFFKVNLKKVVPLCIALIILGYMVAVIFNIQRDNVFKVIFTILGAVNLLLLPILMKTSIQSNLSWLINLPIPKWKLLWFSTSITFYSFILGILIYFFFGAISYVVFLGELPTDKILSITGKIIQILINKGSSGEIPTGVLIVWSWLIFSLFSSILISLKAPNTYRMENALFRFNTNLFKNDKLQAAKAISQKFVIVMMLFVLLGQLNNFDSPILMTSILAFVFPIAFITACKAIIYESKSTNYAFIGLLSISFIIMISGITVTYREAADDQLPLESRMIATNFLGFLAPSNIILAINNASAKVLNNISIEKDLIPKLNQSTAGQILRAKILYGRKNHTKELYSISGKIPPYDFDFYQMAKTNRSSRYLVVADYFDFTNASLDIIESLVLAYENEYQHFNYWVCSIISNKEFSKSDLSFMLKHKSTFMNRCGLILATYYPEHNLSDELKSLVDSADPRMSEQLAITLNALTDLAPSKLSKNFRYVSFNCPIELGDYLNEFQNLSLKDKSGCIRKYFPRRPIGYNEFDRSAFTYNGILLKSY